MKVLYWTELFWPSIGGVEILSAQLLPELQSRGHELLVVTSNTTLNQPEQELWQGIPIHRFFFKRALAEHDLKAVKQTADKVAALKASFKPDVIHLNTTDPGAFFHLTTKHASPAPIVVTVHAFSPTTARTETMESRLLNSANWVAGVSRSVLDDVLTIAPKAADRSSVIYSSLKPDPREPIAPPDQPTLLCVGRMIPEKGFDVAIRAFARIAPRFPNARLVLAGDGESRQKLETLCMELRVRSQVDFKGWIPPEDGIADQLRASTAVIVPSRWKEPFGLVAVQAGQQQRPVIASRTGGLAEIVEDHATGLLVTPGDESALAEAMVFLVEHPADAARMGAEGRTRCEALFGWSRLVREYEDLYVRLAGHR